MAKPPEAAFKADGFAAGAILLTARLDSCKGKRYKKEA